jgi:hypothetical protein
MMRRRESLSVTEKTNHAETKLFVTDEHHVGVDDFTYPTVRFIFRMTGLTVPAGVAFSPSAQP